MKLPLRGVCCVPNSSDVKSHMLATLPSIEALAQMFSCEPTVEMGPPEFGVVSYEVTYETDNDRITLQVLPWAEVLIPNEIWAKKIGFPVGN